MKMGDEPFRRWNFNLIQQAAEYADKHIFLCAYRVNSANCNLAGWINGKPNRAAEPKAPSARELAAKRTEGESVG